MPDHQTTLDGSDALTRLFKELFKYPSFRPGQREAINAVLKGQDALIVMPTGGGKSMCYQLPAVFKGRSDGTLTVVISPLISLMEDQVSGLQQRNIPAVTLNSKLPISERRKVEQALRTACAATVRNTKQESAGNQRLLNFASSSLSDGPKSKLPFHLLYGSPELAATGNFRDLLRLLHSKQLVEMIVVDEAHCISEWGHDFRPDYRRLADLKKLLPDVPFIALTATATPKVQQDITRQLGMRHPHKYQASVFRPNLFYDVVHKELIAAKRFKPTGVDDLGYTGTETGGGAGGREAVLDDLAKFVRGALTHENYDTLEHELRGSAIIYCHKREDCEFIAAHISETLPCLAYHGGLSASKRTEVQDRWSSGEVPAVAATISFGMGIDKADVRCVVHWTLAKSIEGYYQESGRAGRDGKLSRCRLYYSQEDRSKMEYLMNLKDSENQDGGGFASAGNGYRQRESKESFYQMVEYCTKATCRHAFLAKFFGESHKPCGQSCDFCKDPKKVKAELMRTSVSHTGGRIKNEGEGYGKRRGRRGDGEYNAGGWGARPTPMLDQKNSGSGTIDFSDTVGFSTAAGMMGASLQYRQKKQIQEQKRVEESRTGVITDGVRKSAKRVLKAAFDACSHLNGYDALKERLVNSAEEVALLSVENRQGYYGEMKKFADLAKENPLEVLKQLHATTDSEAGVVIKVLLDERRDKEEQHKAQEEHLKKVRKSEAANLTQTTTATRRSSGDFKPASASVPALSGFQSASQVLKANQQRTAIKQEAKDASTRAKKRGSSQPDIRTALVTSTSKRVKKSDDGNVAGGAGDLKNDIAKVVTKRLSPLYPANFPSKDRFKATAKDITHVAHALHLRKQRKNVATQALDAAVQKVLDALDIKKDPDWHLGVAAAVDMELSRNL
eukprot:Clim_evm42s99 gene=Clim_evmTU42s99